MQKTYTVGKTQRKIQSSQWLRRVTQLVKQERRGTEVKRCTNWRHRRKRQMLVYNQNYTGKLEITGLPGALPLMRNHLAEQWSLSQFFRESLIVGELVTGVSSAAPGSHASCHMCNREQSKQNNIEKNTRKNHNNVHNKRHGVPTVTESTQVWSMHMSQLFRNLKYLMVYCKCKKELWHKVTALLTCLVTAPIYYY